MERNLAAGRVADPGEEKGGLFRRPGVDYAG
jgi:hypothetical protein